MGPGFTIRGTTKGNTREGVFQENPLETRRFPCRKVDRRKGCKWSVHLGPEGWEGPEAPETLWGESEKEIWGEQERDIRLGTTPPKIWGNGIA